jgi:hypothetical protein
MPSLRGLFSSVGLQRPFAQQIAAGEESAFSAAAAFYFRSTVAFVSLI